MTRSPLPCPVCAALILDDRAHIEQHVTYHERTKTLGPKSGDYGTAAGLRAGFVGMRDAVRLVEERQGAPLVDDEAPTQKFPPIRETVLRKPPPPAVRELRGAELLRALADAIGDDDDLDRDERRARAAEFDRAAIEAMQERAERERGDR